MTQKLYIVFRLGEDRYALEARQVVEAIPFVEYKAVPHSAAGIAGLFNYRGKILPLVDLAQMALGRKSGERITTRILVVNVGAGGTRLPERRPTDTPSPDLPDDSVRQIGLIAEHATETMRRAEEDFTASDLENPQARYLGPVTSDNYGIVQRIELDSLLSEEVRRQLRAYVRDAEASGISTFASSPHTVPT